MPNISYLQTRPHVLVGILLFLLGLAVYANSLNNGFMMDDHAFFAQAPGQSRSIWQILATGSSPAGVELQLPYYRPLAHLLPLACFYLFGKNPLGYHLTSFGLFWLAAFVFYRFLDIVLKKRALAFLAAVFFLVHPVNGVVVNYITAGVFALQVLLMLGSLGCLVRAMDDGRGPRGTENPSEKAKWMRVRWIAGSAALFILASLCHENALVLPMYAIGVLVWGMNVPVRAAILRTLPLWIVLGALLALRLAYTPLPGIISENFPRIHLTAWSYPAFLGQAWAWYLGKLVYPSGIALIWALDTGRHPSWLAVALLAVYGAASGYVLVKARARQALGLGAAWMLAGFLPLCVATVMFSSYKVFLEPHWLIFVSLGFFVILAEMLERMVRAAGVAKISVAVILLVLSWGVTSGMYNRLWSSEIGYCRYWLSAAPDLRLPAFFLGQALERENDFAEAERYYHQALMGQPRDWKIYASLGRMALRRKLWEEAEVPLRKALSIEPRSAMVLDWMGQSYFGRGRPAEAKEYFQRALMIEPSSYQARMDLARVYLLEPDWAGLTKLLEENLTLFPSDEASLVGLVQAYDRDKDRANTLRVAERLLERTRNPLYLGNLAKIFRYYQREDLALVAEHRLAAGPAR